MQNKDILEIIKLPEADMLFQVKKTIQYLKNTYKPHKTLGYLTLSTYSKPLYGFIPDDVKIYYDLDNNYYSIQDDTYLYDFINFLKEEKILNSNEAILKIPIFLKEFFGQKTSRTLKKETFLTIRMPNYLNIPDINDLKHKNVADSLEYSLLATNILTLLGYDAFHLIGEYKDNDIHELYGFNIIFKNDNYYLFDFYNPITIYNNNHEILTYHPYQMKINSNEVDNFLKGITSIRLKDYQRIVSTNTYQQIPKDLERIYSLGNIIF